MSDRVLLTGASGFLGSHLRRRLLAEGAEVLAVARQGSARAHSLQKSGVRVAEFADPFEVQQIARDFEPDLVFHLATHYLKEHSGQDVAALLEANIALGTNLLEGLVGSDAIVVSAMSYLQFQQNVPTPFSLYSATKQAFLDIAEYFAEVGQLDVRQVVLYDTFGADDSRDKLVPHLVKVARDGSPISLGPSAQQVNLLFVDDVIDGLIAAAAPDSPSLVTVRADANTTVGDLVALLAGIAGATIDATFNEEGRVGEAVLTAGNWPPPKGWMQRHSLAAGLELTYRAASER